MPHKRSKPDIVQVFSGTEPSYRPRYSKVIPGQAMKPSELLKRHLAGTLPPIDLSSRYEYHYDEEGKQVAEPLPLELHEVHKLSVAIRKRQYEEALEHRKKMAEKHRDDIIAEYEKQRAEKERAASSAIVSPEGGKPA